MTPTASWRGSNCPIANCIETPLGPDLKAPLPPPNHVPLTYCIIIVPALGTATLSQEDATWGCKNMANHQTPQYSALTRLPLPESPRLPWKRRTRWLREQLQ